MKKSCLLTIVAICLLGMAKLSAQTGIDIMFGSPSPGPVVRTVCAGTTINIWTGVTFAGLGAGLTGQIDIDWGDGSAPLSQAVTYTTPLHFTPNQFSHAYPPGTYNAGFIYGDMNGNSDTVSLHIVSTNYCGTLYTNVMLDQDGDGSGDALLSTAQIDFTGVSSALTTQTLTNGVIYGIDITDDPYTLQVNAAWLAANHYIASPFHPVTQSLDFGTDSHLQMPGFIVQCDPSAPTAQTDMAVPYLTGFGFRAGQQTGYVSVRVCNQSCSGIQTGDFTLTFDPLLTVFSHNIPGGTVSGNTIHATLPLSGCQNFQVFFDVPGATPALTPLNFSAGIVSVGITDFDLSNNNAACISEVRNSWDPNDKSVNLPETVSPAVQDEFTYVVRFQNMGNDDAYEVVIKDTLDDNLELSSFRLLELSHAGSVHIDPATRIATFRFPDIFLSPASVNEPGSHGYAVYKIREKASLPVGTEIKNTAYIYFDANPPVITNTTLNVNRVFGVQENAAGGFSVFPVPASDFIMVVSDQNGPLRSVKLVDMTGKTVFGAVTNQTVYRLDLQGIPAGVYSLVTGAQGAVNKKVIVQK